MKGQEKTQNKEFLTGIFLGLLIGLMFTSAWDLKIPYIYADCEGTSIFRVVIFFGSIVLFWKLLPEYLNSEFAITGTWFIRVVVIVLLLLVLISKTSFLCGVPYPSNV
ncbi:MAG: hypothetical protein J7K54_02000 [Candidatus Aenigmarchaeota archaeon]|nr:hypothetical protein [Candidatus Aenigmarchaeota archaeon]